MTIEQQINSIKASKSAIRASIEDKGVEIPISTPLNAYAAKIDEIKTGGGGGGGVSFYKGVLDEVSATCVSGKGNFCIVSVVRCGTKGATYGIQGSFTASNEIELSDGSIIKGGQEQYITELLDNNGEKYYWAKDYFDDISAIRICDNTIALKIIKYAGSGTVRFQQIKGNGAAILSYLDMGGVEFSDTDVNKLTEYFANLQGLYQYQPTAADKEDFRVEIPFLKQLTLASNGITTTVTLNDCFELDEQSVTDIINGLGEGDGFISTFRAYNLTAEQKSVLDSKGFNYY